MAWKHSHDIIGFTANATPSEIIESVNIDGVWKLTVIANAPVKKAFFLEGIPSDAFYQFNTAVGTSAAFKMSIGGGYAEGLPVVMQGMVKIRMISLCSITLVREWITNE